MDIADGRELSWDGCVNVRDLGGLGQVRPGAVASLTSTIASLTMPDFLLSNRLSSTELAALYARLTT